MRASLLFDRPVTGRGTVSPSMMMSREHLEQNLRSSLSHNTGGAAGAGASQMRAAEDLTEELEAKYMSIMEALAMSPKTTPEEKQALTTLFPEYIELKATRDQLLERYDEAYLEI